MLVKHISQTQCDQTYLLNTLLSLIPTDHPQVMCLSVLVSIFAVYWLMALKANPFVLIAVPWSCQGAMSWAQTYGGRAAVITPWL